MLFVRVRLLSSVSHFRKNEHFGLALVLALLLAGLSLIHFIVLVFALCFMGVSGMAWALGAHRAPLLSRLAWAAASAALALALAGPWLWLLATRSTGSTQPCCGPAITAC
jgi:hypothetical protein